MKFPPLREYIEVYGKISEEKDDKQEERYVNIAKIDLGLLQSSGKKQFSCHSRAICCYRILNRYDLLTGTFSIFFKTYFLKE